MVREMRYLILLSVLLMSACTGTGNEDHQVSISSPDWGQMLPAGEDFLLALTIDVPYEVTEIEVLLWNVEMDEVRQSWEIPAPGNEGFISLEQMLSLKRDLPPGEDYRLEVTALRDNGRGSEMAGTYGYSTKVRIITQ